MESQQAAWCPTTAEEALPAVLGLLPPGPAWDGARVDGTISNMFWRAVANLTSFVYVRLNAFWREFYCHTANESLDQWRLDYGLPDECDAYGSNLCSKVTAEGGQSCEVFVALARDVGWAITCEDVSLPEPVAGCFQVGCTPLGPTPVPKGVLPGVVTVAEAMALVNTSDAPSGPDTILLAVPGQNEPAIVVDPEPHSRFWSYGHGHVWRVTVDLRASMVLQGVEYSYTPISNAGNLVVGCTSLCSTSETLEFLKCYFRRIKPAHTVLQIEVLSI